MISFRFNSSLGPIWQWVNQLLCKIRFFCHSVEALKLTISEIFRTLCPFLKRGITSSRYSTVVRRSVLGKKLTMVILRVPELLKKCYVIILKNDKKLVKQKNTAEERNKRKFFFTLKETASNKLWAEIRQSALYTISNNFWNSPCTKLVYWMCTNTSANFSINMLE